MDSINLKREQTLIEISDLILLKKELSKESPVNCNEIKHINITKTISYDTIKY